MLAKRNTYMKPKERVRTLANVTSYQNTGCLNKGIKDLFQEQVRKMFSRSIIKATNLDDLIPTTGNNDGVGSIRRKLHTGDPF